jgi:hypothetical protein
MGQRDTSLQCCHPDRPKARRENGQQVKRGKGRKIHPEHRPLDAAETTGHRPHDEQAQFEIGDQDQRSDAFGWTASDQREQASHDVEQIEDKDPDHSAQRSSSVVTPSTGDRFGAPFRGLVELAANRRQRNLVAAGGLRNSQIAADPIKVAMSIGRLFHRLRDQAD